MSVPEAGASPAQRWDPDQYARTGRFVADLAGPLVELLAPRADEIILDLGCGDGALTAQLALRCAKIVGVDSSPEQIEAARTLGLDAHVVDGHALAFDGMFDAVISNAALHWMKRPDAVIDGMWRALKPGGRVAGEMGGAGNVGTIVTALTEAMAQRGLDWQSLSPWFFPTVDDYRRRLEQRGFEVREIALIPRPTPLPGDIADWLETFAQPFLGAVDTADRAKLLAELVERLRADLFTEESGWVADYVRLRFLAFKPDGEP